MRPKSLRKLINRVYSTQEGELDCDAVQQYLPAFIDSELNNAPHEQAKAIKTHLKQCPDCQETFEGLYYVASLEIGQPLRRES